MVTEGLEASTPGPPLHDPAVQVKFFGWLVPLAIPLRCDAYRKRNPTSRGRRTMPKFMHAYPGSSPGHIPGETDTDVSRAQLAVPCSHASFGASSAPVMSFGGPPL